MNLIFDSRWEALVKHVCRRLGHPKQKPRRRMRGEITCSRCFQVLGYWR